MKKSIREWDLLLAHAEFAYNKSNSKTTSSSPFAIVNGQNPIGPLDLAHLPTTQFFSADVEDRAKLIKQIHEQVRSKILKQTEKCK